jgi:non-specific protein-tyrosine kinase
MDLRTYWDLFRRWAWLVALCAILAAAAAYAVSIRQIPIYRASARLLVGQNSTSTNPSVAYTDILLSERLTRTYAQILTARPLLEQAAKQIGIAKIEPSSVSVQPVRDTQLLNLSVEHPLPALAAEIANTLPQVFIAYNSAQQRARFQESKQALTAELAKLSEEIEAVETRNQALAADDPQAALVQGQLAQYRSSYGSVLSQLESIRMAEANAVDTVTVVEPAVAPRFPVRPRVLTTTLLALIVGAMLGVGVVFLIEYLDDTVKLPEHVEAATGLSTLGVIGREKNGGRSLGRFRGNGSSRSPQPLSLVTLEKPRSPNAEAYRTVRTGIQFSSIDDPIRSLVVTSPGPSEGKSTTAANLAVVMAQAGKRVVLIDGDLRKPAQHKLWGAPNTVGLTGLLLLEEEPKSLDFALTPTRVENLWVITSGQLPHNPSELLGSQKLQRLVERLLQDYDVLVFDAPPALAVTDPIVLGQTLDGVLLVVDSGSTRAPALAQTVQSLAKVQAHLIGVVLNKFPVKRGGYYYYYYHHYYEDEGDTGASGSGSQGEVAHRRRSVSSQKAAPRT